MVSRLADTDLDDNTCTPRHECPCSARGGLNYYRVLSLDRDCNDAEIKEA